MSAIRRIPPIGGTVHIHPRRRISESGISFVVAINPARGPRWESSPIESEDVADAVADALADFAGAEVVR